MPPGTQDELHVHDIQAEEQGKYEDFHPSKIYPLPVQDDVSDTHAKQGVTACGHAHKVRQVAIEHKLGTAACDDANIEEQKHPPGPQKPFKSDTSYRDQHTVHRCMDRPTWEN